MKKGGRRTKPFVMVYREVAQDRRLSLEARGLFMLMTSLPGSWRYTVTGLAKVAGCGRDKLRRMLEELERVGYLLREQSRGANGRFQGNVYVLQQDAPLDEDEAREEQKDQEEQQEQDGAAGEEPAIFPLPEKTDVGESRQREKPLTGFPTEHKKIIRLEDIPPYSPPKGWTCPRGEGENMLSLAAGYFKSRCWSAFSRPSGARVEMCPHFRLNFSGNRGKITRLQRKTWKEDVYVHHC